MDNSLIIIQARFSSTRMPGKVLLPIWQDQCLLDLQLGQLRKLGLPLILATTTNPKDDELVKWAQRNDLEVFRGDEENVLKRFIDCARYKQAEYLIRVCSDNPFLQTTQIEVFIQDLLDDAEYTSLTDGEGVPAIRKHWGLFVEGVRRSSLEKAASLLREHSDAGFYQEHVTIFIYGEPNVFRLKLEKAPDYLLNRDDLRFTIDTPEDFRNMQSLLEAISGNNGIVLSQLVETVDRMPEVKKVMLSGIKNFSK